jgi:DNA polymerase/3'-5' exonuclease PolX
MTSKDERYREKITEAIEAANKVVDAASDRVTEETLTTYPDLGQKMTKINGLVRNGECSLFEAVKTVFGSDSEEFKQMLTTAADLEKLMGLEPGALVEDAKKPYKQDE